MDYDFSEAIIQLLTQQDIKSEYNLIDYDASMSEDIRNVVTFMFHGDVNIHLNIQSSNIIGSGYKIEEHIRTKYPSMCKKFNINLDYHSSRKLNSISSFKRMEIEMENWNLFVYIDYTVLLEDFKYIPDNLINMNYEVRKCIEDIISNFTNII